MDHIAKALERARQEKGGIRGWIQPSRDNSGGLPEEIHTSVALDYDTGHPVLKASGADSSKLADHYRLLRTRILQQMKPHGWHSLGITSPGPKAGKTVTSINLSISIARDGRYEVVLVDADLRRPSIARYLGLPSEYGLIDFLSSDASIEDVLVKTDVDNLMLVPGRDSDRIEEVPELLHSDRMSTLVSGLRNSRPSRIIVVDMPPALIGDDVIASAPHLDALLLVIEDGGTDVDELNRTLELLDKFNLLGTALNKSHASTDRGLGYGGYYYSTQDQ